MNTLEQLAASISTTAADYRKYELGPLTPDHVTTWVHQFDPEDCLPILTELDHVLKKTYFSEAVVTKFLQELATEPKLVGADPVAFWKAAGVLDIQQGGNSQTEMLERFETVLKGQLGITLKECKSSSGNFVYLDDAVFTGNRVRRDLEPWIESSAPQKATIHVIVNALHAGSYYAAQQLDKASKKAGKDITVTWWRARFIENRKVLPKSVLRYSGRPNFQKTKRMKWLDMRRSLVMLATHLRNERKAVHPRTVCFQGRQGAPYWSGFFLRLASGYVRYVRI